MLLNLTRLDSNPETNAREDAQARIMKYDDASWHSDAANFPKDEPPKSGATHIGMFVTWMVLNGFASDELMADWSEQVQMLKPRQVTPGQFVWQYMDGQFSSFDLSEKGRLFADAYYRAEAGDNYLKAYETAVKGGLSTEYLLPDTWETYAKVSAVVDAAYQSWSAA